MNYTFNDLMIAYIRGYIINNNIKVNENLIIKDINSLDSNEIEELISIGKSLDLKLYYFKEKDDLARVSIVLGFLRNIWPESILDVGSGRGVFLFPLLREFPDVKVTSIERTIVDSIKDSGKYCELEETLNCINMIPYISIKDILKYLEQIDSKMLYKKVGIVLSLFKDKFPIG